MILWFWVSFRANVKNDRRIQKNSWPFPWIYHLDDYHGDFDLLRYYAVFSEETECPMTISPMSIKKIRLT